MNTRTLGLVAAVTLLAATTAWGQTRNAAPPDRAAKVVDGLDRNGDGCIDQEEARNYSMRRFGRLDKNGDGQIDASELPLRKGEPASARPITRAAWQEAYRAHFAQRDANGNGCLSESEIRTGVPKGN